MLTGHGINRNIVECKDIHTVWQGYQSFVLIETLWNVKNYEGLTGGEK